MALLLRYWWVIAILFVCVAIYFLVQEYNDAQRTVGENTVTISQQGAAIEGDTQANETRNNVARPDTLDKYCSCVRSTATPANCRRYVPSLYKDHSQPASLCTN